VTEVVSLATQLAESCSKLYNFWNSIQDAPQDVAVVTHDLMLLSTMLKEIADSEVDPSATVEVALQSCRAKLKVQKSHTAKPKFI
jgi:hypothetical protein